MLDKISAVPKPVLIGVAALLGLVALAATIGTQRKQATPEAAQAAQAAPAAPVEASAQEATSAAAEPAPAATAATAAAPVAVGLPPAIALDAPQQPVPGAVETVEVVGDGGAVTALGGRRIDGQALGLVDMAATRTATSGAGWSNRGEIRVTRAGLVRVPASGSVTLILSNQSEQGLGGYRTGTACRLAVGDPGNVLLTGEGDEQATAAELLAGWHRVFVVATREGMRDTRCRLAIKPAGADLANVAELFELPSAAAPAQAGEGSP